MSLVFPVYNEESNIALLYRKVREECAKAGIGYEMIFVDDGSVDNSLGVIKDIRKKDADVKYISFSRNFGHQNALFAGMSKATGDAVITMDADLQQPPSLIPKMIELWRGGADVVYTSKRVAKLSFAEYWFFNIFYWLMSNISGLELKFGQSDFRLLDRRVLEVVLRLPEYHKFLRGQIKWVGFKQEGLLYDVDERHSGTSKYLYRHRMNLAMDGIISFSRYPLHIVMQIGIITAVTSFIYIVVISISWALNILEVSHSLPVVQGWATLVVTALFMGSLQLIAIGILGEYIGRIYDQVKGRPVFIAKETSDENGGK